MSTKSIPRRLEALGYASYAEYLRSPHWFSVKERYRKSKLPKTCYVCDDPRYELHHRTYKRMGSENLNHLLPLCRSCHQGTHDYLRTHNGNKLNLWTAAKQFARSRRPRGSGGRFKS